MTAAREKFEVADEEAGLRLDQVIPRHVVGLSRRKARAVIDLGGVFVDRARVKVAGRVVRAGQTIEVVVGGALERAGEPPIEPTIVHVDEHVIVVDKPAGLVTAPTPESDRGDLLDQLHARFGDVFLVHRLDRATSGLLVFARTREANKALGDAFKVHAVERAYRAVAIGEVEAQTIDRPIDGRRAITHVEPIERFGAETGTGTEAGAAATLLAVRLETGRTHQIRVHLAGIGHPVAGDRTHGGEAERIFIPRPPRLALHATELGFRHPTTRNECSFHSRLPDDLATWLDRLRR